MYEFSPVSERVSALRKRYRETFPAVSTERMRIVTDYYMENPMELGIYKRAHVFQKLCERITLRVEESELIVGNLAPTYRGSTLFPEYGLHWLFDELKSGVFESRGPSEEGHAISPEDKEYILSTEDFWRKNSFSAHMDKNVPAGLAATAGNLVMRYTGKGMANQPIGHYNTNYNKVVTKGFRAIRNEAQAHLDRLEGRIFGDDAEKYAFYRSVAIVSDACITYKNRFAALCREKAESSSGKRRAELIKMAENLEWIFENPCRTFYEAVQAIFLYHMLLCIEGSLHGLTIGRLDQYLGGLLDADLAAGRLTMPEAQEIIDCLFLKISDMCKVWSLPAAKNSGGYSSGTHMTLGGQTKDGLDATNKVSFMMLESSARLRLHEPPLSLRVHSRTPRRLLEAALETTKRVGGIPTLQNDGVIIPALLAKGLSLEDARNYCIIGCVEPSGTGCEFPCCGSSGSETYWNIQNAFMLAINNGVNPVTGQQGGLPTGYLRDMSSFDEVKEAYVRQVNYFVDWHVSMTNTFEMIARQVMPLPLASAMMDGCMESGRDLLWGGAKYNSTGFSAVGCANVADSLACIKYFCFDEETKRLTPAEMQELLLSNWEGQEPVRQEILNSGPHYGNNDPYADELARWAMNVFADRVNASTGPRGKYRPGAYPVSVHVEFGRQTDASPDGRTAHEPLADGVSPRQNCDRCGPIASLKSVAFLDHMKFGNGTLLNMKFHPKTLQGAEGTEKFLKLLSTYFDLGGMHVQYNVVSGDTLRAAQKNPEEYKDLVIRIAGFSAYFIELHKELQDDLIARTELSF